MIKRVFLYSILIYFLILITLFFTNSGRHFEWAQLGYMIIFSVVIVGIGLFIGVFLSAVFQRPTREKWFYLFGQLLPPTAIAIVFIAAKANEKKSSNSEENRSYVFKLWSDLPEMGVAFDSLNLKFHDPNDFRIKTTFSRQRYVHAHSLVDSFWVIYFDYTIRESQSDERFAKFIVYRHAARMIDFNRSLADGGEYSRILHGMDSLKQIADSIEKLLPPE